MRKLFLGIVALLCFLAVALNLDLQQSRREPPTAMTPLQERSSLVKIAAVATYPINTLPQQESTNPIPHKFDVANSLPVSAYAAGAARRATISEFRRAAPGIFIFGDRTFIADMIEGREGNRNELIMFARSLRFREPRLHFQRAQGLIFFRTRIVSGAERQYDSKIAQHLWGWLIDELSSDAANPDRFKIPYAFAFDLTLEEHALIEAHPEKILEIIKGKKPILTWITPEIQWSDRLRMRFLRYYTRILRENGFVDWAETVEKLEGIDYHYGCASFDIALGIMDESTAVAYFRDYLKILKGYDYVNLAETTESLEVALARFGGLTKREFEIAMETRFNGIRGWEVTENGDFRIATPDIFTLNDRVFIADITEENKDIDVVFSISLQFRAPALVLHEVLPLSQEQFWREMDRKMRITDSWLRRLAPPLRFYEIMHGTRLYAMMHGRSLYNAAQVQDLWGHLFFHLSSNAANPDRFKIPYAFAFDLTREEHALIEEHPEKILEIIQGKRPILTWISPEIQWGDKLRSKFLRDYIRTLRENGFVEWAETIEKLEGKHYLHDCSESEMVLLLRQLRGYFLSD